MQYFTKKMGEEVFVFQDRKQEPEMIPLERVIPMDKFKNREVVKNNLKSKIRRVYHGK